MTEFILILRDIILPVFIIMAIGYILQKKFALDVSTLAKINIYFLVPGFIFIKLYETDIAFDIFGQVILFLLLYVGLLYIISAIVGKRLGFDLGGRITFQNSVLFYNSGNYAIPVNDLVFRGDPFAMSIQVIVLLFQNIFLFSYGIFSLQSIGTSKLKAMLGYFKMPVMYAMLAGGIANIYQLTIPSFIIVPVNYIAQAMIAMALLTLGAQVAQLKLMEGLRAVYMSMLLRLIIGPIIGLGIIYAFGIDGVLAQALFIAAAMPTAVNSAVIAQEYNNNPDLAAQIVLFSTAASAFTVTLVIFVGKVLFG